MGNKRNTGHFFLFSLEWKNDQIKRTVVINGYEEGGLKMPHFKSFCCALKMSWTNKLEDPLNFSPWKTLLLSSIQQWEGDNILYLNKKWFGSTGSQVKSILE